MPHDVNSLTGLITGSAIQVHKALGPGLLESAYRLSLGRELQLQNIPVKLHWPVPLEYKGLRLRKVYQADLIVADTWLWKQDLLTLCTQFTRRNW